MVLGPIVRTCDTRLIRVYRRVRRSADLELGKLVEIDFDRIVGVLLAYSFDLAGLPSGKSQWRCPIPKHYQGTYALFEFCVRTLLNYVVGEGKRRGELFVLLCEVHGGEEGQGNV